MYRNLFFLVTISLLLMTAGQARAEVAVQGTGGVILYVFFAFCAIIAVAQLIPVVNLLVGVVRSLFRKRSVRQEIRQG